jgi:hypothetical protein
LNRRAPSSSSEASNSTAIQPNSTSATVDAGKADESEAAEETSTNNASVALERLTSSSV